MQKTMKKIGKYLLLLLHVLLLLTGMCLALALPENTLPENTLPESTLPENTLPENVLPENTLAKYTLFFLILSLGLFNLASYCYFRRKFIRFSDEVCQSTEKILQGHSIRQQQNKETLTSKMVMELEKAEDIFTCQLAECRREKSELQKMISELTHQIKAPATNIQMYCEMFADPHISPAEARQFAAVIQQQLAKLGFLLDALEKSSRLEKDMIHLQMENNRIVETLALAVSNVIQKAEQKKIEIAVSCRPAVRVYHDMKWTAEAIENILDNAVKYTPENGKVLISVEAGEMYTAIKITDTGKGIEAAHRNDIFKRFYREKSSSKEEGLGLGLYLARNIITLQGGYISVHSSLGKGSSFTVCLPNRIFQQNVSGNSAFS